MNAARLNGISERAHIERTRAFFNKPRPTLMGPQSVMQKFVFDEITKLIPSGDDRSVAVDLGCHWGRYTRILAETYGAVIGVDFADEVIASMKDEGNISYKVLDVSKEGVRLREFPPVDLFLAVSLFEMLPNPEDVCRNLAAAARSGGRLLAVI